MVELTKTDINRIVNGLYNQTKEKYGRRPPSTKKEIRQDLEEICRHPKIKDITYKRGVLRFYTTELPIRLDTTEPYEGQNVFWREKSGKHLLQVAPLGEFEITQYIRSKKTRIRNLTNSKKHWDHPHVSDSRPCFYQFSKIKNNLVRRLELVGYIELILQFLDTYEPAHTAHAVLWLQKDS